MYFFCLASFIHHNDFKIHSCCFVLLIVYYILLLMTIPLYGRTTVCLSIYQCQILIDTWVVSNIGHYE